MQISNQNHDEVLFEQYQPLIKSLSWRFSESVGGYEEAERECFAAFAIALDKFNVERGAFGAFLKIIMLNQLRAKARAVKRERDITSVDFQSVEYETGEDYYSAGVTKIKMIYLADPNNQIAWFEVVYACKQWFLELTTTEQWIIRYKMRGFDQIAIAATLRKNHDISMSQPTVARYLDRLEKSLRTLLYQ